MKRYSIFLSFLFVFVLMSHQSAFTTFEQEEEGKKIFKKYCAACHGADGTMEFNGAKDFTKSTMSLDERVLIISEGRNMMTAFKSLLSAEEIKTVAEYTLKLSNPKE